MTLIWARRTLPERKWGFHKGRRQVSKKDRSAGTEGRGPAGGGGAGANTTPAATLPWPGLRHADKRSVAGAERTIASLKEAPATRCTAGRWGGVRLTSPRGLQLSEGIEGIERFPPAVSIVVKVFWVFMRGRLYKSVLFQGAYFFVVSQDDGLIDPFVPQNDLIWVCLPFRS